MNNAIEVQNVSKKFILYHQRRDSVRENFFHFFRKGSFEVFYALKNISFEIKKGEFFGIIGRNGSGKSTLLKILAGVYCSDAGAIHVSGKISPFLELGVGFNGELSARDNIFLNGTILGLSKKQIEDRFNEIIHFSELERFVDTKLKNYSSGMYARLAFSLAIQVDADILIMDEVLAVGDADFQKKCFAVFEELKKAGKTIILVSHALENIEKFCDRALLLDNGKMSCIGPANEVLQKYRGSL